MDKETVAAWLQEHGFERRGAIFVAPIKNGIFEVELNEKWARSTIKRNGGTSVGNAIRLRLLQYDQNADTLNGLGLYTMFAEDVYEGSEPPIWFSQQAKDGMRRQMKL